MFADHPRTETVGGGLQGGYIVHREESVVVFPEADFVARQFPLHEGVAVEVIRGVEREKRCDANDNRPEHLVPDIEVVMREAAALVGENPMVRIFCRVLRHADTERPALFHAPENEVNAKNVLLFHAA